MLRSHFFSLPCACLVCLALASFSVLPAEDAKHDHSHENEGHDHPEVVAYQLSDWHEKHFEDAEKAAKHLQAIKKLGCEVKQDKHEGHIDIIYRSPTWKEMKVADHKLAEQWGGWLKEAGFDTHHVHVDESFMHGDETIQLRLVKWKTAHLAGPELKDSKSLVQSLQKMGCAVKNDSHDGHADITYRCPTWVTIHVADHAKADQLDDWLKDHGFETKHAH